MLSEEFSQLADRIDDWQAVNISQELKHGLTCALRIARSYSKQEIFDYLLQNEQNAFADHLNSQLERVIPSVKKHLIDAMESPENAWMGWVKKYPSSKPAPASTPVSAVVPFRRESEGLAVGLERILGLRESESFGRFVAHQCSYLGVL